MSIMKVVANAKVYDREPTVREEKKYVEEGTHVLEIQRLKFHKKEGINGGELFFAEFVVVESSNPDMEVGQVRHFTETFKFDGMKSRKTGEIQYPGAERVKQLILSGAGGSYTKDALTEEVIAEITGQENLLCGKKVKCISKRGNNPESKFLYHNFYKI